MTEKPTNIVNLAAWKEAKQEEKPKPVSTRPLPPAGAMAIRKAA